MKKLLSKKTTNTHVVSRDNSGKVKVSDISSDTYSNIDFSKLICKGSLLLILGCLFFSGGYQSFKQSKYMKSTKVIQYSNRSDTIVGYYDENGNWVDNKVEFVSYDWTFKLNQLKQLRNPISLYGLESITKSYNYTDSEFVPLFNQAISYGVVKIRLQNPTTLKMHWYLTDNYEKTLLMHDWSTSNIKKLESWCNDKVNGFFSDTLVDTYFTPKYENSVLVGSYVKDEFYSHDKGWDYYVKLVGSVISLPLTFVGSLIYDLGVGTTVLTVW